KWLAPGTTSRRLSAGSAQLRSDSIATVIAWASASWLRSRIRWETMPGANCLRAVTTSHIESPHRPLSWRRSATSATACWPRSDWLRASRYTVVPRQTESAAGWGMSEANQRIQPSVIEVTPCFVAPRPRLPLPRRDHGIGGQERHGEWAHPAWAGRSRTIATRRAATLWRLGAPHRLRQSGAGPKQPGMAWPAHGCANLNGGFSNRN